MINKYINRRMKKMLEGEDKNGQRKKNTACPDQTVATSWQLLIEVQILAHVPVRPHADMSVLHSPALVEESETANFDWIFSLCGCVYNLWSDLNDQSIVQ